MRLEITTLAKRDIKLIYESGTSRFGQQQAEQYVTGLLDQLDLVMSSPQMYRVRTEFGDTVRLAKFQSHMIFYRMESDLLLVLRVLHGKQDWAEYF